MMEYKSISYVNSHSFVKDTCGVHTALCLVERVKKNPVFV